MLAQVSVEVNGVKYPGDVAHLHLTLELQKARKEIEELRALIDQHKKGVAEMKKSAVFNGGFDDADDIVINQNTSHISIQVEPQLLDSEFNKNMEKAHQQLVLAYSASILLDTLKGARAYIKRNPVNGFGGDRAATIRHIDGVIAKAENNIVKPDKNTCETTFGKAKAVLEYTVDGAIYVFVTAVKVGGEDIQEGLNSEQMAILNGFAQWSYDNSTHPK